MPAFDDDLTATIASAKAKLAEREQAKLALQAQEIEQARAFTEKFANVKNRAMQFKHAHLESLFRKAREKLSDAGFDFIGNFINDEQESSGTVGSTLESGEDCCVQATINYSPEKLTARVDSWTSQGLCFSATQEFKEETSPTWFETNVAQAIGKLLESGEVTPARAVRCMAR